MSTIAPQVASLVGLSVATLVAIPAPVVAAPATSARQVLSAHRAATSIGADPCRSASPDDIVVCGQRDSPYALPLYDPDAGRTESRAGGSRLRLEGELAARSDHARRTAPNVVRLQRSTCSPWFRS